MNKTTYAAYLDSYSELTLTNVGTSMLPMLKQGRDLFTLQKKTNDRCRKYDVVLYRRPPDQYVLHRIVAVRETDYVILGDNCLRREYGITDEDILAVMTKFVHRGKEYAVTDRRYRLYAKIWYAIYPMRCLFMKLKSFCRCLRKEKH